MSQEIINKGNIVTCELTPVQSQKCVETWLDPGHLQNQVSDAADLMHRFGSAFDGFQKSWRSDPFRADSTWTSNNNTELYFGQPK